MATITAYQSLNMGSPFIYTGTIIEATSSNIWISNGILTSNYSGSFKYSGNNLKSGSVTSYSLYSYLDLEFTVSNIKLDAKKLNSYLNAGNAQGLQNFVTSGNDIINGSSDTDVLFGYKGNDLIQGNGGADLIVGNEGSDTLYGGDGADYLDGGVGKDTLYGGSGGDTFFFGDKLSSSNLDTIADFTSGADLIGLVSSIFTRLSGINDLSNNFVVGTKALDSDDYLIFNASTRVLSYDADGSGKGKAVAFVKLTGINEVYASDLEVITD
jgi:Ca2+-binding RTX toxin-like protein